MTTPRVFHARAPALFASVLLWLAVGSTALAQTTGTIEGRVSNPVTGAILEGARITVDGTNLETFSNADGYYRLTGVPAGAAQVRAFFTGFPAATATLTVAG